MNPRYSRVMMLICGCLSVGALAIFLTLQHGSPGPLSAPHAEAIQGTDLRSCDHCHADQGLTQGCLNCHQEIVTQIEQDKGYHAYLLKAVPRTCQPCHPEHHGRDFDLVGVLAWQGQDPNLFDHLHVAYKLTGKHNDLACAACHQDKRTGPFTLSGFSSMARANTKLGLNQSCISCHTDVHARGQAKVCDACHDQQAFKPAPHFRHDTYYVLAGAHLEAACSACHLPGDQNESEIIAPGEPDGLDFVFGQVRGKTCVQCHPSPHRASVLNRDCDACHLASDATWSLGERGMTLELHTQMGYPLEGAHASALCETCHPLDKLYAERYPDPCSPDYLRDLDGCQGCHEDPHNRQFDDRYPGCVACHTQTEFKPTTFTTIDHMTLFPLMGSHEQVACETCHARDPETGVHQFSGTPHACRACHQDPHQAQFQDRYKDCSACHDPNQFAPSTFTVAQHAERYVLTRPHAELACDQCHGKDPNVPVRQFAGMSHACQACHQDPHEGQFQDRYTTCLSCHHQDRFMPAVFELAQHAQRYALTGAHEAVACIQCHTKDPTSQMRRFVSTSSTCKACHQNPHGTQFQQELREGDCTVCHLSDFSTFAIRPFDHEKRTRYPLTGVHIKVACLDCHPSVKQNSGLPIVQYRPLSTHCEDCHGFIPN
jgi:hypothetical protein